MPRDVFVSYSQPDRDCAFELVARIESHGISAWIAPRDVSPSADWAAEIIDAISAARVMVLVFSAQSNSSPQVHREVERAVHKQLRILPFRIEDVLPTKSLEYFLSTQHWLDAFPPPREPHYAKLCTYLDAILNAHPASAMTEAALRAPPPRTLAANPGTATPNVFDASELHQLERQLAHYIGPVAKHLVRLAAVKALDIEDLTLRLASELDSDPDRRHFIDACRHLRRSRK
jgi:hypothetical protein